MLKTLFATTTACLLTLGWFCVRSGEERFLVTGSSTVAPILQTAVDPIEAWAPELKLEVQTGGSTRGIRDARAGVVGAGMASRDLLPEEREGLEVVPIAFDGIALIVHADNPVSELTSDEVRRLFRREASWDDVGGSGRVTIVNKAEGRATLDVFLAGFELDNAEIDADVVIGDNAQGVRLIGGNERALGYVSVGEALHAIEAGAPIRLVELDGTLPSADTVADGTYPVRRTLYLLLPRPLAPQGERLIEFMRGPRGRRIVADLHFVPIAAEPIG